MNTLELQELKNIESFLSEENSAKVAVESTVFNLNDQPQVLNLAHTPYPFVSKPIEMNKEVPSFPSSTIILKPTDKSPLNLETIQTPNEFPPDQDTKPKLVEIWGINSSPSDEQCHVCDEKAGKHTAYGGKVCPSCRAFFRRSVQTRYYEIFTCNNDERCPITTSTRKSCKYCRFMKCLKANMQISWVLSETERDRRFNKLRKVTYRNNLNKPSSPQTEIVPAVKTLPKPNLANNPEIHFTIEEHLFLQRMRDYFRGMINPRYEYFFSKAPECLNHIANVSYFGGVMNYDLWKQFLDASDAVSQEIFINLDSMTDISVEDRLALIKRNALPAYCYIESVYIEEEDPSLCVCLDILNRLRLADTRPVIRYDSIYTTPWASSVDDEDRHRFLWEKIKNWALPHRDEPQERFGYDPTMTILIRLIIGFRPDDIELQDRSRCDWINYQFCMMLYRYMKSKFGDKASVKYAEAMDMCASAREIADIISRRLPV